MEKLCDEILYKLKLGGCCELMDELDKFTSRLLLMILGFLFVAFVSVIAVNIIGAQLRIKIAWALGALIVIVFLSLRKTNLLKVIREY